MSEIIKWGPYQQELANLEKERLNFLSPLGKMIDRVTVGEIGSIWARTLDDYIDILTHNGAPDIIKYAKKNLREDINVVDAGCACGIALTQMHSKLPKAKLFGIDIRDVSLFKTEDKKTATQYPVNDLFKKHKVNFFQESYLNINKLIPQGYDLLFCVGAYLDYQYNSSLIYDGLKSFYDGLRSGGMGQIFLDINPENYQKLIKALEINGITHQFHEANPQILHDRHNGLFREKSITGTLTIGPKK
jgi:hypothetical protein